MYKPPVEIYFEKLDMAIEGCQECVRKAQNGDISDFNSEVE